MRFIGFLGGFLPDRSQPDKRSLFTSAMLSVLQLLNSKQLKPELHSHRSFPSPARKQGRFSEKRKGTGQLQAGTRAISYQSWVSDRISETTLRGSQCFVE